MRANTRKIMAFIILFLTVITSIPINVFATFITDINSNAEFGVIEGSLAEYGHELHYANYDGGTYMLFCTQFGKKSPTGKAYNYGTEFLAEFKANRPEYERMAEMIYFGYAMNYGMGLPNSPESKIAAACTQQYVWENLGNAPARDSWNGYMSSGLYDNWLRTTEGFYNQYHSNVSFNGTSNRITLGGQTVLSDANGVLQHYPAFIENIDGVIFNHEAESNELTITVTDSSNAESVTFNTRNYGIYELMPNGATYNSSTMSNYVYFEFTSGNVQNLMFSNYIDPSTFSVSVDVEYGNTLVVKTNSVGNVLANCTFELYRDEKCTQKVRAGTSDSNGQTLFQRLVPGTYYVKEINVPYGYLLDTNVQKVDVRVNEITEISFKNLEPTGEITLIKTDRETGNENRVDGKSHHGDATLDGTEYTLYAQNDIYNVAGTVKYFSKDDEIAIFTFNSNGIAKITVKNKNTSANIIEEGNSLKGLPMGSYYVKETKVPEGYLKDTETHFYNLSYKDMNTKVIKLTDTLTNLVKKAKFEVIKVSSVTNTTAPVIDGAEFTAILTKYVDYYGSFSEALKHLDEYAKDEYSIFTTGSNGHIISGLLAYGNYTVNETYCPSDRLNPVKEFYVTIDNNSTGVIQELIENDTPFQSYLKLIKKDIKTGKFVTNSSATFSLYKLNEETNEWEKVKCKIGKESIDKWNTDENGLAYTETKLEAGIYKVDEIKVPTGFLQLEEECIFEVSRSNDTLEYDKDFDAYITVQVKNEQPTGTLILEKSVAIRENVDTSLVDISDLSGIEFKLTAKENIIDYADGTVIYEKGEEVRKFNIDKNGNYKITDLPMREYQLQETKTLKGLVLDKTIYDVIFEQKDLTTKVYEVTKELKNDTTLVEISKTEITGEDEIEGATLTILDKAENIIDTWVSGKDTHKIEGLEVGETYILREVLAPKGYVKATDIEFKIENTNKIQKVKMIDKIVKMKKSNIGGEEIVGATIQVFDEQGNIVDSWISEKEEHNIQGLEEGKSYILHEEIAPAGYVVSTDIRFDVTLNKETQKLNLIDKIVEMSKVDIAGEEIEGATIQVIDKTGKIIDEWVSTKDAHKISNLVEGETYILHEEIAVDEYVKATDVEFTVSYEKETQHIEMIDKVVEIVKTDLVTGEEIEGAELQVIDEQGNIIDKWTSTKEPHKVIGLEEGKTYTLTEITCPYGYEKAESITFTVTLDKETQLIEMKDMPILKNIKLIKIDSKTREVINQDFSFGIYEDEACTKLIKEVHSNKDNGTILFENLRYGTYFIKEIEAPNDYMKSDRIVKVEINDNGVFIDNNLVQEDIEKVYTFEFENVKIETPNTSDISYTKLLLVLFVMSSISVIGIGFYEYKRRKIERN